MNSLQSVAVDCGLLFTALVLILCSSELFTNGVEWLGQKLQLSEGVVGSVLAAVGTALPETFIPVIAVFGHDERYHEIGIGAIAGAPFMLSTLTMSVCGMAVFIFARSGRREMQLKINRSVLSRDLFFFISAYGIGLGACLASSFPPLRQIIACLLLLLYVFYLKLTFSHEGEPGERPEELHFERLLKLGSSFVVVLAQVFAGLAGIVWGAHIFVDRIHSISEAVNLPSLILAMIVAPVATELPEKCNSVIWVRSKKDSLALGNITGAMVFQSCFPVAFGVAFTKWQLGTGTILSGIVALLSAAFFLIMIRRNSLEVKHMILGGLFYAGTIACLLCFHLTS